jgi:hypothetical protein
MSADSTDPQLARKILDDLIQQRRQMQADGLDDGLLEANRLGIVYWQLQLARASAQARRKSGAAA